MKFLRTPLFIIVHLRLLLLPLGLLENGQLRHFQYFLEHFPKTAFSKSLLLLYFVMLFSLKDFSYLINKVSLMCHGCFDACWQLFLTFLDLVPFIRHVIQWKKTKLIWLRNYTDLTFNAFKSLRKLILTNDN